MRKLMQTHREKEDQNTVYKTVPKHWNVCLRLVWHGPHGPIATIHDDIGSANWPNIGMRLAETLTQARFNIGKIFV